MANKYRGEVGFSAGGKDYTFRLGTNELAFLEEKHGIDEKAMTSGDMGICGLRTIFRVGLSRRHEGLTDEQAGDVIDELGGFKLVGEFIDKSMSALIPEDEAPKPEAAGTGPVSSPPASAQG